ncbi:hypothetical protein HMF7854_03555 [Sphingomonas ginkgonis]|uniref:Uncharacterized protein n=1 Tax=Sphingomonas ginkgonis TaxID=2315330 RepID=A0A3R9Y4I5_9SPHN|nr:TorF family putative porin [Sphingomonas ginkgonis]RST30007.1 hypothetical protein HMF7854_03555 [Sphingomonas ginkgonis]
MRLNLIAAGMLLAPAATTAAAASELPTERPAAAPVPALALDYRLSTVSDYRNRGITVTRRRAALQQELRLGYEGGAYGTLWTSTIAGNGRNNWEIDAIAGWTHPLGGAELDLSAVYYVFPGIGRSDYGELNARIARSLGGPEVGLLVSYAPRQRALGGRDNVYVQATGSLPLPRTPLTLQVSFGVEQGAFGNAKRDWTLGVSVERAGFTWTATYVDTAHSGGDPLGRAGLVLGLGRGF